jgi:cell division protein ZapE
MFIVPRNIMLQCNIASNCNKIKTGFHFCGNMIKGAMPLISIFEKLITQGHIERNEAQMGLVTKLSALSLEITAKKPLFSRKKPILGLYIYGEVGRGKTFLMDLFYENLRLKAKKRAHFHEFMADIHAQIFSFRQSEREGDPIAYVALEIMKTTKVLCFDEFSVTDIADAMILGRLFQKFFDHGMVIIATSNRRPDMLYYNGLNRALFLPFIAMLESKCEVISLDSRTDYRQEKLAGVACWQCPPDKSFLDSLFLKLTGEPQGKPLTIPHIGRLLHVPQALYGVARFSFSDLCEKPHAASDYLSYAHRFHTILIDDIPRISVKNRDHAKRFINLIDALYDNRVKLYATATHRVRDLYEGGEGHEAFEFARTESRLIEMRSEGYLSLPHGRADKIATA